MTVSSATAGLAQRNSRLVAGFIGLSGVSMTVRARSWIVRLALHRGHSAPSWTLWRIK